MRIDKVVVNSSPLIVLFRSGQAELLPQLFKTIVVPDQVYEEIMAGRDDDPAKKSLVQAPWVKRKKVAMSFTVAAWNLGDGESAVFSFAKMESGYRAMSMRKRSGCSETTASLRTISSGRLAGPGFIKWWIWGLITG